MAMPWAYSAPGGACGLVGFHSHQPMGAVYAVLGVDSGQLSARAKSYPWGTLLPVGSTRSGGNRGFVCHWNESESRDLPAGEHSSVGHFFRVIPGDQLRHPKVPDSKVVPLVEGTHAAPPTPQHESDWADPGPLKVFQV